MSHMVSQCPKGNAEVPQGQEKEAHEEYRGDTVRRLHLRDDGFRGARGLHIAAGGDQRRRVPAEAAATAGRLQRSVTSIQRVSLGCCQGFVKSFLGRLGPTPASVQPGETEIAK